MSSTPHVDAYIAEKEAKIQEEYENILKVIEEHFNEGRIIINITHVEAIKIKLSENGFKFPYENPTGVGVIITW